MMRRMRVRDAVRDAAGSALDPALAEPLRDHDMIRSVHLAADGRAKVTVSALTEEPGYLSRLTQAVHTELLLVEGVRSAQVHPEPLAAAARAALGHRLRTRNRPPGTLGSSTRVYAVGSGKGGVGKSSVTANLAVALAESGQRVGVLDADVWGWSMPQLFGVDLAPVALSGIMLPVRVHGVRLMSMGFFVSDEPVVWRGPMLHKALEQFLADVYWGRLDVLLVDLPPGTGDVPLSIMQLLPDAEMLVVTTPQTAAVRVAARTGRMALDSRLPVAGVVENMSGSVFGNGGGDLLASTLGSRLLASVPLDESMREAGDAGVPVVLERPRGPASEAIRELALSLPITRPSLVGKQLPLFVGAPPGGGTP